MNAATRELLRLALPRPLRDRIRHQDDNRTVLIRLFGDDALVQPVVCDCNLARMEHGHMESCPLHGFPPAVFVVEGLDARLDVIA